jgi:hypothetical protein
MYENVAVDNHPGFQFVEQKIMKGTIIKVCTLHYDTYDKFIYNIPSFMFV